jgi:hypothetical protein
VVFLEGLSYHLQTIPSPVSCVILSYFSWSFGVLLYEIFSLGETPYSTVQQAAMIEYLEGGNRLSKPPMADDVMSVNFGIFKKYWLRYNLMKSCWFDRSDQRPSFDELRSSLINIVESNAMPYGYIETTNETTDVRI